MLKWDGVVVYLSKIYIFREIIWSDGLFVKKMHIQGNYLRMVIVRENKGKFVFNNVGHLCLCWKLCEISVIRICSFMFIIYGFQS
jgi:hypothetical protein